jgi:PKD repeat protein
VLYGKDASEFSSNARIVGNALELAASADATQYALFRFDPAGDPPDSVRVELDQAPSAAAYIGLANFKTRRWDLSGPYAGPRTLPLDSTDYVSAQGNTWVAVLGFRSTVRINELSVRTLGADQPPVAALTANSVQGVAPLTLDFDASASGDPDGEIVAYDWDWTGDWVFDDHTTSPFNTHQFDSPGIYEVVLRVTDNEAATDSTQVVVTVDPPAPPSAVIDPAISGGTAPLELFLNGNGSSANNPQDKITLYEWDFDGDGSYDASDTSGGELHTYGAVGVYHPKLRVTNGSGQQGTATSTVTVCTGTTTTIDFQEGKDPNVLSFVVADGRPAALFYDKSDQVLHYAQATDTAGTNWELPQSLVADVDTGCLTVADGNPAVSFGDYDSGSSSYRLRLVRATDADGSGWSVPVTIASGPNEFFPESMSLVNGLPAIVFTDDPSQQQLRFVQAMDAAGANWQAPVSIGGEEGSAGSLVDVAGNPAVCFIGTDGSLYYVRAIDANGQSWDAPRTVAGPPSLGRQCSMAVVSGDPAISYVDAASGSLRFVRAWDAEGSLWSAPVTVDDTGDTGAGDQLCVVGGKPAISYCSKYSVH